MSNVKLSNTKTLIPQREIIKISPTLASINKRLRAAGYARVSSDSDDQLNSFSAQVRYYTNMIEQNPNWEFTEVYADEGITGVSTEKRNDFNRMLEDCRKGRIDRIITKSTSRFARNTMDTISIIRELKAIGVTVFFEKENIDTANVTSENLLTLYALFAQEESLSISKNCRKGNQIRMKKGTYVSSSVPYGYRLIDNQLVIYESEARIIRRIFAEYLGGYSTVKIALRLMEEGIQRKKDNYKWNYHAICNIIKNERYVGDMLLQKSYGEEMIPYRRYKNKGELAQYYVKDAHDPIVERIQFILANILLKERTELISKEYGEYPLSRKIKCRECNTTYRRQTNNEKTYWVCRTHISDKKICSSQRIPENKIYESFIKMYNKLKKHYEIILLPMLSQLEKLQEIKNRENIEIREINKQIAELSEQNHVMNGLLTKGILDSALFISQTDEINQKIRKLKLAKSSMLAECSADNPMDKTEELIEIIENSQDYIVDMNETLFGEIVDSIIAKDNNSIDFILINGLRLTERL